MEHRRLSSRSLFSGVLLVTICTAALVIVVAVFLNQRCVNAFWSEEWVYPGAQTIDEESIFLGRQQWVLFTADTPSQVQQWYSGEIGRRQREAVISGDFDNTFFREPANVAPASTGQGTEITFSGQCP